MIKAYCGIHINHIPKAQDWALIELECQERVHKHWEKVREGYFEWTTISYKNRLNNFARLLLFIRSLYGKGI